MAIRSLRFVLTGEDKSASKTFDKVGKNADRLGTKVGTGLGKAVGFGIKGLGGLALGAGAAGVAAVGMAPKVLSMAGALEQTAAKANTVFGPKQIGAVDKWAKTNAHAMGLTTSEAKGLAAGFGDLLVPMGFTREQAAKMSTDTIGLAGALSQWSSGTVTATDAADRLSAAMLGETDGLKDLGISISAADVEARLAAKGQKELEGAARQQAEAVAIQAMIFEKSTDAQAAFKTGGDTLLGQQSKLTAQMKELRDKGIAALAPKLLEITTGIGKLVEGFKAGTGTGGKLREAVEGARARFEQWKPVLIVVGEALVKLGVFIGTKVIPVVFKMQGALLDMVAMVVPPVLGLFSAIVTGAAKAFGWVPGLGPKLKTAAKEFETFKDDVNTALSKLKDKTVAIKLDTRSPAKRALDAFDVGTASGVGGRGRAPRAGRAQNTTTVLKLDGRTVAKVTETHKAAMVTNGRRTA